MSKLVLETDLTDEQLGALVRRHVRQLPEELCTKNGSWFISMTYVLCQILEDSGKESLVLEVDGLTFNGKRYKDWQITVESV